MDAPPAPNSSFCAPAASARTDARRSARRPTLTRTLAALAFFLAVAHPAFAQEGFGLRGGMSIDPDQGYFGMQYVSKPLVGALRLMPAADVGFGDDVTLAAFHVDFAQWIELNPRWSLYFGGGPAVNVYRFDLRDAADDGDDSFTELEGGFDTMVGFAHDSGLTFELRIGANGSPDLRFGVAYTFR